MARKRKRRLGHVSEQNVKEIETIVTRRCVAAYSKHHAMTSNEREIGEDACVLGVKNTVRLFMQREGVREDD